MQSHFLAGCSYQWKEMIWLVYGQCLSLKITAWTWGKKKTQFIWSSSCFSYAKWVLVSVKWVMQSKNNTYKVWYPPKTWLRWRKWGQTVPKTLKIVLFPGLHRDLYGWKSNYSPKAFFLLKPANDKTYLFLDVYSWGDPATSFCTFKWPPCAQQGQPEATFF